MGFVKSVLSMKKPKNSLKTGDWHEIADLFRIMHAGKNQRIRVLAITTDLALIDTRFITGATTKEKAVTIEGAELDLKERNRLSYFAGAFLGKIKKTEDKRYYV